MEAWLSSHQGPGLASQALQNAINLDMSSNLLTNKRWNNNNGNWYLYGTFVFIILIFFFLLFILFILQSLQNPVCTLFTEYLNLEAKFSLEIFDLYLVFILSIV